MAGFRSRGPEPFDLRVVPYPAVTMAIDLGRGELVLGDAAGARQRTSIVAGFDYAVDSNSDWQLVLPSNKMFDSPEESVEFTLRGLSLGAHQVTLRATDARGNQVFETGLVTVEAPTAQR